MSRDIEKRIARLEAQHRPSQLTRQELDAMTDEQRVEALLGKRTDVTMISSYPGATRVLFTGERHE